MILYVNGDSNSFGLDADYGKRFSSLLANEFNFHENNHAVPGASNQRIIRTTTEFLKHNRPDFVMIGWTTWEREEWFHEGKYVDINSSGHNGLPEILIEKYKKWTIEQTPNMLDVKSKIWHEKIFSLHETLRKQNIKHLFFNCMYNFFAIEKNQEKDWSDCFLGPYDNSLSYYWYLKNKGYQSKNYHYDTDGHAEWAKILIEFIREKKLI